MATEDFRGQHGLGQAEVRRAFASGHTGQYGKPGTGLEVLPPESVDYGPGPTLGNEETRFYGYPLPAGGECCECRKEVPTLHRFGLWETGRARWSTIARGGPFCGFDCFASYNGYPTRLHTRPRQVRGER